MIECKSIQLLCSSQHCPSLGTYAPGVDLVQGGVRVPWSRMRAGYASNYVTEPCTEIVVISRFVFEGKDADCMCKSIFLCLLFNRRIACGWPTAWILSSVGL